MKAVLVSIDGTLADPRHRQALAGTPDYTKREAILKDEVAPDSLRCLRELAHKYKIVYIALRPADAQAATEEWLQAKSFPAGPVMLANTPADQMALVQNLKGRFDFAGGIGSTSSDNALHLEVGCLSIMLKAFEGDWDIVRKHLLGREHTVQQTAITLLTSLTQDIASPAIHRLDVKLEAGNLPLAVRALQKIHWGYLSAITGVDDLAANEIEVIYHLCSGEVVLNLRVRLPRVDPAVPSICAIIPSATFFERELSEMFGINVIGTPNPDRLFLPEDWPAGMYPLRKDVTPQLSVDQPDASLIPESV